MAIALAACGGGGGNGASAPNATGNETPSSMTGTVAIGSALTGATVTVIDATGKTASATSGTDGTYSVSIAGMSAPFLISAADPSGAASTLYSVAASLPTGTTAPVVANVTPLTTAVAALLTQSGNPLDLTAVGGLSSVSQSAVSASVAKLDAAIAPILTANGLSATSFDPIGATFTPNQTGADAVIDSVAVTPSTTGTGLQLASLAAPDTAIQLNLSTAVSTPLQAPSQPANYLATLVAQLGQCQSGTASACSSAIDASYLNHGFSTMQQRHSGLFATGSTLTGVKTVAFLPANTLPNISNAAALVEFLYTSANGQPNFASDIVQQLPNGSWDVIGDQEQFDVNIASFVGRMQFTDGADANNSRLESGLNIQIPASITVSNPASVDPAVSSNPGLVSVDGSLGVGSALVQGPGLPSSSLYMLSPLSGTGSYLTIPSVALTEPYGTCGTCRATIPNGSMNTEYKWSWATLAGGSSAWSPNGAMDYAAQAIDVSTVPQFSVYTVTMYDTAGNQIGQPQKVIDVAPNLSAAAGTTVSWQTLGSDVIANLLTPGGSSTSVTGNASTSLDWTAPSDAAYPNFWASINSLGAPVVSNGVQTIAAQPYDDDNSVTPTISGTTYSETFPAGFVDVLTTTGNASAEQAVQLQLNWQAGGEYFSNTWQYNN